MRQFNRGVAAIAVFVAVLAPALAVGAQSVDSPAYWETQFQHDARCHSSADAGHGFVTDDGLSVVLFEFDLTWTYGDHWEGLVVFGDGTHVAYEHPDHGVPYPAPGGAAVTDWIVCKGVAPAATTTTTSTTAAPEETTTTTTSTTAAPEETTTTTTSTTAAPEETTTTTTTTSTTAAPEETTTTATSVAPAGGVATGAGGTAGSDQSALLVLLGVAAIATVAAGGYAARRRSES